LPDFWYPEVWITHWKCLTRLAVRALRVDCAVGRRLWILVAQCDGVSLSVLFAGWQQEIPQEIGGRREEV
jgi:hypothetical protein